MSISIMQTQIQAQTRSQETPADPRRHEGNHKITNPVSVYAVLQAPLYSILFPTTHSNGDR